MSSRQKYLEYLPFYYVLFLILRKVIRQGQVRYLEAKAKKRPQNPEFKEGPGEWRKEEGFENPAGSINKPAFWIDKDFNDPSIKEAIDQMRLLKSRLDAKHLRYCSPAGTFNPNTYTESAEKVKTWENAWVICHSQIRPNEAVLDLGGASTLLSFYLASMKCRVSIVDNDWGNCGSIYNTRYVGRLMNWDIKAYNRDLSQAFPFKDNSFDRVFSICVLEHLSCEVRRFMMKEVGRVLKDGGIAALTFDYGPDRNGLLSDKGLRFAFRDKIERDIIRPSGLKVIGNLDWIDAISQKGFVGALFLRKQG